MLHKETSTPGNFLLPLVYLQLLCLPQQYWHAPDLLRFPSQAAWENAIFDAETLAVLGQRLAQYDLLTERLRGLFIYLQSRPATLSESSFAAGEQKHAKKKRVRISPTDVMALLDNKSFRAFLADQVMHEARHNPCIKVNKHVLRDQVVDCLHWAAPELFTRSLTLLAQQGWIDLISASTGKEFLIRLKQIPARSAVNGA